MARLICRPCARRSAAVRPSRSSLRIDARRSGSTASRTAQPGSVSCRQSAKRQPRASSAMSANASATPAASASAGRRTPGVSMSKGTVSEDEQLAVACRVAAAIVARADREHALDVLAEQQVDQRRLADSAHPTSTAVRCGSSRARSAGTPEPSCVEDDPSWPMRSRVRAAIRGVGAGMREMGRAMP
jgi:hypothetical protein